MGFLDINQIEEVLKSRQKKQTGKILETFVWRIRSEEEDVEKLFSKIDKKRHLIFYRKTLNTATIRWPDAAIPFPGDDVVGYISGPEHVIIHKKTCTEVYQADVSAGRPNCNCRVDALSKNFPICPGSN